MNGIVLNEITEYRYHINQNGFITLDEYMNADVDYVVIPEEIEGHKVIEIAEGAFENRKNLLGISLPNTIIKIADKAFFGCNNLKMIHFGCGIKRIGNEAFAECHALEKLKITAMLDYLGEYAFVMCGLKQVEILGIKEWGESSFAFCSLLQSFSIKKCSLIPEYTFKHDIRLSNVMIEKPVDKICGSAFYDCRSFDKIVYKYWDYLINEDLITEILKNQKLAEELKIGSIEQIVDEAIITTAEEDARRLEKLESIKLAKLNKQKQFEQEAKERLERLKAAKIGAEERAERIRATEQEVRERAEQIRQVELEMRLLAELEAKERAEYIRLADLEAQERAELEIAERRFQAEIEAAERKKKFISLVKYAKIIPGYYVLDIEDDSDMVTAGRLYSTIKEKKIKLARIASIMPPEAAVLIENGTIPLLPVTDAHINLWEHETLHYKEYVEIYMAGPDGETINSMAGTLYITNQRIHIETGSKEYNIASNYLRKAVLYDVMPEIIEFASARETFFIRTPNPGLTYQFVKLLLSNPEDFSFQDEEIVMNMEEMSIDFLKDPTLESYIYGVRTMLDMDMPLEMKEAVNEMVKSLGYLDLTLKKYPSHKENAYNFFEYYIPEAVKILYSYNEYEKAGLRAEEKNPVYEKVMVAVRKVADAAKQQVVDIYKDAITDTTARARALAEILGQDGYVDPAYLIR